MLEKCNYVVHLVNQIKGLCTGKYGFEIVTLGRLYPIGSYQLK